MYSTSVGGARSSDAARPARLGCHAHAPKAGQRGNGVTRTQNIPIMIYAVQDPGRGEDEGAGIKYRQPS